MKKLSLLLFIASLFVLNAVSAMDKKRKDDSKEENNENSKKKSKIIAQENNNNNNQKQEKKLIDIPELIEATKNGPLEKIKELLEKGANPNFVQPYRIPQHVRNFFIRDNINAEIFDNFVRANCGDQSALTEATKNFNFKIVKLLLENGANPNLKINGKTAIHLLIPEMSFRLNNLEKISQLIELFLSYNADFCIKDDDGNSVLHLAVSSLNGLSIVKVFLETYAKFLEKKLLSVLQSQFDNKFEFFGFENLMSFFVKHSMSKFILLKNNNNQTSIDILRSKNNYEMVEFLELYLLQAQDTVLPLKMLCLQALFEK